MKKYIFSGNEEWLKKAKEQCGDQVIISSDYEKLLALQDDPDALIFTLHDKEHPMDTKGHKTPYLFNEFRNVDAGAMFSDVFLEGKDVSLLPDMIKRYDIFLDTAKKLKEGELQLHYDGWFFSGGRGEDADMFRIFDGTNLVADLSLNEDRTISLRMDTVEVYTGGWYERINNVLYDIYDELITPCLKRDDPEICEKLTDEDGALCFPRDYCDIDREDILDGTYELQFDENIRE